MKEATENQWIKLCVTELWTTLCDDHKCPQYAWSCGDGECIFAFPIVIYIHHSRPMQRTVSVCESSIICVKYQFHIRYGQNQMVSVLNLVILTIL